MSYDIYLEDENGNTLPTERHWEGGTYNVMGEPSCELNVTYNYAKHFRFRELDGKTGEQTLPMLEEAVARLGTQTDIDYWAPTEGNAGYACSILLAWARQHPQGRWAVH